jgi:hypothetical protein
MTTLVCIACGNVIAEPRNAWWEITGWERQRKGGGTNAVFDRRRTGSVMCDGCHQRRKWGHNVGQGELWQSGSET